MPPPRPFHRIVATADLAATACASPPYRGGGSAEQAAGGPRQVGLVGEAGGGRGLRHVMAGQVRDRASQARPLPQPDEWDPDLGAEASEGWW